MGRDETGTWLKTGLHYQAWKAIGEAGVYKSASWVVKVDADAVFLPSRLVSYLSMKLVPASGIYLENCKNKKWKPTCDSQSFPAYHPLMKPADYWACWETTTKAFIMVD